MFRGFLATVALVLVGGSAAPSKTPPPAVFSLILESTSNAWAARCDSGCRWHALSFHCRQACGAAVVEPNGVVTVATPRPESAAFGFIVQRTGARVRARARTGTVWQTLSWGCTLDPCRARVDAYGVSGIDRMR